MGTVKLYYFTGSGNTLKIGRVVKETFEKNGYQVTLKAMEYIEDIDVMADYVGLLFPVAIQSTYPLVWDFINRMPQVTGQKVFMIDTMEAYSGGVVGPVKKVLKAKGYDCIGAIELKMNSSMLTKEKNLVKLREKNDEATKDAIIFVERLLRNKCKWHRIPVFSDWMRVISKGRNIWTSQSKKITIDDDACITCKVCIKHCPVSAMEMVEDKVTINHEKCNACMRCVHKCPKKAILINHRKIIKV